MIPLPENKRYKIIYADPAWRYKQSGNKGQKRGMAEQHYKTMSTEEICNLSIGKIKTDDAVCLMWATFPNIKEALKVMRAWGFVYKTAGFVWIKKNKKNQATNFWGMGAYTRANAEVCLLGISPKTRASECVKSHKVHQIIEAPIESHSKKPDVVRDKIVELFGDVPRIELFARKKTAGWDAWGDQTDYFKEEAISSQTALPAVQQNGDNGSEITKGVLVVMPNFNMKDKFRKPEQELLEGIDMISPAKQLNSLLSKLGLEKDDKKPNENTPLKNARNDHVASSKKRETSELSNKPVTDREISEILTAKEVAKLIKVKAVTIYAWAKDGDIPCVRFGKSVRFNKAEILEWLKNR